MTSLLREEDLRPVDPVTTVPCIHLGIEYGGLVVRAERWPPAVGRVSEAGCHFKIVLLQEPPHQGLPKVVDPKVAVCVPNSAHGQQSRRIIDEITAAKQAAYLTRRDVNALAIGSTLRERQQALEGELQRDETARFNRGNICVSGYTAPAPSEIFSSQDPDEWTVKLASFLLHRSYPNVPVETHPLSQPFRRGDVGPVFVALVHPSAGRSQRVVALITALGFSSRTITDHEIFQVVRESTAQSTAQGPADFGELHRRLAHELGLTEQLASLFLLLFLHHEQPEHQIQLRDHAELLLADGRPLRSHRLTPDLTPLFAWDGDLPAKTESLGPASPPSFAGVKHHLSVLFPEVGEQNEGEAKAALPALLAGLRQDIGAASRVIETFGGGPGSVTGKSHAAVTRLGLLSGHDFAELCRSLRATYPSLPALEGDLEILDWLASLEEGTGDMVRTREYISKAEVPADRYGSVPVNRDTLQTALSPGRLTRPNGRRWDAIARDAEAFTIRYIETYQTHHQQVHDVLPGFLSDIHAAKKELAALELLDTIEELGPPSSQGLGTSLAALSKGSAPCSSQANGLELSSEPVCQECRLRLRETVTTKELGRITPQINTALAQKTETLSRPLVDKVLTDRKSERWQAFLEIVQASEPSSLANTLEPSLVSLIRQVLD